MHTLMVLVRPHSGTAAARGACVGSPLQAWSWDLFVGADAIRAAGTAFPGYLAHKIRVRSA